MEIAIRAFGAYPQLLRRGDAPPKSGNAAGVDRRGLTPHLMRDIGLVVSRMAAAIATDWPT